MADITEIDAALTALATARAQMRAAITDFDNLPGTSQIAVLREFETERNQIAALDLHLLAGIDRAGTAANLCRGNLQQVLTSTLLISRSEAKRRVQLYQQLGPRTSMLGEQLDPKRPVLAAAVTAGTVSAEKAQIIATGLAGVDRVGFDPADIEAGEQFLTDKAPRLTLEDIRVLTARVVDAINPDGSKPDDDLGRDRRFFELQPTKDGNYVGKFRLTGTCGAKLAALLRPLSETRTDDSGVRDDRPFTQRQHDALEQLCDRLLRDGLVSERGGTPATVIVTITADDLTRKTGHATTTAGTLIPTKTLLKMAGEADIIPAVLNASGAILDLGRTKRCATRTQTLALIARDIGCSFPGCHIAPEWTERHHILPWVDGGLTNLDNLTLLCTFHHHNFLNKGWQVRLNKNRLPEWIPPRWIDPDQTPQINTRIRTAHDLR